MNPKGYRMTVTAWSNFLRLLWSTIFPQLILVRISQLTTDHPSSRRRTDHFLKESPHFLSDPFPANPGKSTQPITCFLLLYSTLTITKAQMNVPTPKTEALLLPLIRARCFNIMPDIFRDKTPMTSLFQALRLQHLLG